MAKVVARSAWLARKVMGMWGAIAGGAIALGVVASGASAAPYAAIVMDARDGRVLYQNNADARLHPASLTKMLTLYIAFDAIERGEISPDQQVTISGNAAAEPPSRLGLRKGQKISLRHLIRAAALRSANDAATAIGEAISGSEPAFADRMNRTARALGMTSSTFRNANGLTASGHLSTARDMNTLGRRLVYDFPGYYQIFSRRSDSAGVARVANTNRRFLGAYSGSDGIKTGFTNAAGYNLTASAQRGNKRVVATIFGGKSTPWRNAKMAELLDLGFGKAPARVAVQLPTVALDRVSAGGSVAGAKMVSKRPRPRPEGLGGMLLAGAAPEADVLGDKIADAPPGIDAPTVAADAAAALSDAVAAALSADTVTNLASASSVARPAGAPEPDLDALAVQAGLPTEAASPPPIAPWAADVANLPTQGLVGEDALGVAAAPASVIIPRPRPRPGEIVMTAADSAPNASAPSTSAALVSGSGTSEMRTSVVSFSGSGVGGYSAPTPEMIVAAAADVGDIVAQLSTSGARHWGVTLGTLRSQAGAERLLLKTALAEPLALDGALRRVAARPAGYEANFLGLGRAQADLVCQRLQARGANCFVIGP